MLIRAGYELILGVNVPTAMTAMLKLHPSRLADLRTPMAVVADPALPMHDYIDRFGNICTRMTLPPGDTILSCDVVVEDGGEPDPQSPDAIQHPVADVPDDVLIYLLGSRYCETDRMSALAWGLFGHVEPGWARVQAIVDYSHRRLAYGYEHADATRTAHEGHEHRVGVCRDFAHLAVALCRCMNIPARYCTGYLGDIGVPVAPTAMDFHAWFDVYLGGGWHVFDARHNQPRIGRILMAHGRDATDTALTTTFGPVWLNGFKVHTDEVDTIDPGIGGAGATRVADNGPLARINLLRQVWGLFCRSLPPSITSPDTATTSRSRSVRTSSGFVPPRIHGPASPAIR